MQDLYQIPALILTALLLPAFGHLCFRSRNTRTILWFLALLFAVVRMCLLYPFGLWYISNTLPPWISATAEACALPSSGLFLASLSPLTFRIGRWRILYVFPYILPMIAYAILSYGVFRGAAPKGPIFWIFPALGAISVAAELCWDRAKGGALPAWTGTLACLIFGTLAFWCLFRKGLYWPVAFAESGNDLITALLVLFTFRRISAGTILTVTGFVLWSMPAILILPQLSTHPFLYLMLVRLIVMANVIAAMGLVLIVLEDELAANQLTSDRERRARQELEAYTSLMFSRRRVEDFDRQGPEICETVIGHSRFEQAALVLLRSTGEYRLAGSAGLDGARERALDALVARIAPNRFLRPGSAPSAVENSLTVHLSLEPWMQPGDDLKRLNLTSVFAIPLPGRTSMEGALLVSGLRNPSNQIRTEDLLPMEMLATRLQAFRSQTMMLEKLIDSEKFAGLGQLAGNVTQQLNNPLTVILGYASLLEDAPHLDEQDRRGVSAILSEARHMRSTIESLARISRNQSSQRAAISVNELLADLEQLHRSEFLQRSIELRLQVAPALPRVLCHAQQLRQAVLHCLQFAMDAVENFNNGYERTIRVEASSEGNRVQIMVAHSGTGFSHPERAFDPYLPSHTFGLETAGLGLSLCATILRDNNGTASAVNLEPSGAAILLELQTA